MKTAEQARQRATKELKKIRRERYDYYECGVCKKIKPVGGAVVRKIAYNKLNVHAQCNVKQEARLSVYYVVVCPACDTEHEG